MTILILISICVCFQVSLVDKGYLSRCASLQWPGLPLRLGQLQLGDLHGPWSLPPRLVELSRVASTSNLGFVIKQWLCSYHSTALHFQLFVSHKWGWPQSTVIHLSSIRSFSKKKKSLCIWHHQAINADWLSRLKFVLFARWVCHFRRASCVIFFQCSFITNLNLHFWSMNFRFCLNSISHLSLCPWQYDQKTSASQNENSEQNQQILMCLFPVRSSCRGCLLNHIVFFTAPTSQVSHSSSLGLIAY